MHVHFSFRYCESTLRGVDKLRRNRLAVRLERAHLLLSPGLLLSDRTPGGR